MPWWLALAGCYVVPRPESEREPDAGFSSQPDGGDEDRDGDARPPYDVRHPACRFSLASDTSAPSWPRADPMGEPLLDAWTDIACADASSLHGCDATTHCPFEATCVQPVPGAAGYCAELVECADGIPLSYRDGACSVCTSPVNKAALCCAGVPGVDCRRWPFETQSQPGEACFDNDDCAAGLVCSSPGETGFSFCVCPGVRAEQVERAADCGFFSMPGSWGRPLDLAAQLCTESAPGWVDELVEGTEQFDHDQLQAVRGPDGNLHLLFARGGTIRLALVQDGAVLAQDFELSLPALPSAPAALAVDANGALHLAYTDFLRREGQTEPQASYATNASGSWVTTPIAAMFVPTDLALDAAGAPVVAGRQVLESPSSGLFSGAVWRLANGVWSALAFDTASAYPENTRLSLDASGAPTVYWSQRFATQFIDGAEVTTKLFDAQSARDLPAYLDLAQADDGTIHLVFDAGSEYLGGREIGQGRLRVLRRPGPELPEVLYDHADPRYMREPTAPSIAFGPAGERLIAHRTFEGVRLRREQSGSTVVTELITPHAPASFELGVDGAGEPHLFYVAKGNYPWEPFAYAEELRHVHRGSCL